jgi:hypothetical protein
MISIGSYSEILREKKEPLTVKTACFLQIRGRSSTRDFIRDIKSLHYAAVEKDQCRALQWRLKNFWSGLRTYQSSCKRFHFLFLLNVVCYFTLHLIDLYSQKCWLHIPRICFSALYIIIPPILCQFQEGPEHNSLPTHWLTLYNEVHFTLICFVTVPSGMEPCKLKATCIV